MADLENRRPLKSRNTSWAAAAASLMARAGISPNAISAMSVVFGAGGCALFLLSGTADDMHRLIYLLAAATCIQLRLLCNLLDGMVAVEYAKGSSAGPIWNELPDRFADVFFLAGAGYAAQLSGQHYAELAGWLAAVGAVATAYVRELGRGLGLPADFSGPMAKQQRMAALTIVCLVAAAENLWGGHGLVMVAGLVAIVIGTGWTVIRRVSRLVALLAARP
jgi:phosphatidylglycerophosphate synthase